MRKLKLLSIALIGIIGYVIILTLNSYSDNAVVKSSVLYESYKDSRRLGINESLNAGSQQIKVQFSTLNRVNDVIPSILVGSEITSFSTDLDICDTYIEEPVAGITKSLNIVDEDDIKEALSNYLWTTERVNIRKEASTNSDILVTIDRKSKIEALKKTSSEWMKIRYGEVIGYIHSKYLRDTETPILDFTDTEINMLQRIVEAECTDCSIEAKENVASVIINRILHNEFPDDVEGVIFQERQFSPTTDGRFNRVNITQDTVDAVNNVLKYGTKNDALYFCNIKDVKSLSNKKWFKNLTYLFKDTSGHSFYR